MYCSLFDIQIREAYPGLPEKEYEKYKERDFAGWLKYYVSIYTYQFSTNFCFKLFIKLAHTHIYR